MAAEGFLHFGFFMADASSAHALRKRLEHDDVPVVERNRQHRELSNADTPQHCHIEPAAQAIGGPGSCRCGVRAYRDVGVEQVEQRSEVAVALTLEHTQR